jgi:hypothetical protein
VEKEAVHLFRAIFDISGLLYPCRICAGIGIYEIFNRGFY